MITLRINGKHHEVDVDPDTPLLWVIRDRLGLTGTKYSCGIGACGSCTVHIDGKAQRSCQTPLQEAGGKNITTIEGIPGDHPVIQGWINLDVPQCGYCQSGQIMEAVALLEQNPHPSDDDIDRAMAGNLCRCGTYQRVRRAIHHAASVGRGGRHE